MGNQVLFAFSKRILNYFPEGTTIGRWGGDIFAVIVPEIDKERELEQISERVIAGNKEPLNKLKEMGVDLIQGFYFSKPLPQKDFLEYVASVIPKSIPQN